MFIPSFRNGATKSLLGHQTTYRILSKITQFEISAIIVTKRQLTNLDLLETYHTMYLGKVLAEACNLIQSVSGEDSGSNQTGVPS